VLVKRCRDPEGQVAIVWHVEMLAIEENTSSMVVMETQIALVLILSGTVALDDQTLLFSIRDR
jgi:hypothetical protein